MPEARPFLCVADIAQLLNVTDTRVRQLVRAGLLPHVRRGRRIFIPLAAWERWLAQQADRALSATPRDTAK